MGTFFWKSPIEEMEPNLYFFPIKVFLFFFRISRRILSWAFPGFFAARSKPLTNSILRNPSMSFGSRDIRSPYTGCYKNVSIFCVRFRCYCPQPYLAEEFVDCEPGT